MVFPWTRVTKHWMHSESGAADNSAAEAVDKPGLPETVLLVFRAQQGQQASRLRY